MTRLYEIGISSKDFCFFFGITGLLSRSAKILMDGRFTGYECYQGLDYCVIKDFVGFVFVTLSPSFLAFFVRFKCNVLIINQVLLIIEFI